MSRETGGNKNESVSWKQRHSGMLGRVAIVRTDVSERRTASVMRVIRIGELGTTLAVTSNRSSLFLECRFLSPWWWRRNVPPKHRFLQEPQDVTSQKTAFLIVTAVRTSNLTNYTSLLDGFQCGSPVSIGSIAVVERPIVEEWCLLGCYAVWLL
jgi:hypothetical protein